MCDDPYARDHGARRARWPLLLLVLTALTPPVLAQTSDAPAHHESLLRALLPDALYEFEVLGLSAWQWVGSVLLVLAAVVVSWVMTFIGYRIAARFFAKTETQIDDRFLELSARPVRHLLALGLFAVGSLFLDLPASIFEALVSLEKALGIAILAWLVVRMIDLAAEVAEERLEGRGHSAVLAIVPLGRKMAKVTLFLLGLLAVLQNLGFHVTGLLAGLGVGGLAVALAAQKTVENLFGGAILLADRPVRVGDFCKFSDKMGVVEEVGLRSTRVRSLDRTLITIPNADFSQFQIENFGVRDRVRLTLVLGLRYETEPDQLRHVLAGLRKVLLAHPMIDPDPARVRFVGLGAYSLDIEIFAYASTTDWATFLAVREDVLLRFMDVVAESGTGFAFPSQTTYLGRDTGLDTERTESAREEVRSWRKAGKLPFPEFSQEAKAALDDTLDWPPEGAMPQAAG